MKTAKKLLSIILVCVLLVSTLSLLFTTASAADYAFMRGIEKNKQIMGAYNYDNSIVSLVEDPTLPGTDIRAMTVQQSGNDKYGYIGFASDETATATEFVWEPNTKYALSFDYMLGDDATIADFNIYYGAAPTYAANVPGKQRINSNKTGVSLNYKGDGKYHNAFLTFTTPEKDTTRPHLYLRIESSSDANTVVHTYMKNFKLVKYSEIPTATPQADGWEKYFTFDQDGNATPAVGAKDTSGNYVLTNSAAAWTSSRFGDADTNNSHFEYNADGTLYADTHTDMSYTVGQSVGGMSFTVPKAGNDIAPFIVREGSTYDISVRFKFTESRAKDKVVNPNKFCSIGFAYLVTGADNYSYKQQSNGYFFEPINIVTYGDTGYTEADTWYTLSLNNWTAQHSAVLRLCIRGQAGFIIDKVNISNVDTALTSLTVNDNGAAKTFTAVKGAKLDGFNAAGVEGKKFDGWYTTATFDEGTKTDVVPNVNNAAVYAKYVSEVKDLDMVPVGSIRPETAATPEKAYVSAGIRFKGRIYADYRATATEIGFVAVPSEMLGNMTVAEYLEQADNAAMSIKVKGDGVTEKIYEVATDSKGKYYDYQMCITGLTRENVQVNLLDTKITAVMYVVIDGQRVYAEPMSYCYNDVADKMAQQ